jgi:arylsulfatase
VVTIPELLRENGYNTFMTGKWHLGEGPGYDPHDRGFGETFILETGGGSHFNDLKALSPRQHMAYTRNGAKVELPSEFYSTTSYTDTMIRFIDTYKNSGKPFFGYLAYTAVHDPLHAPSEYIARYKGKFDMGWDSLYTLRFNNLKKLGIVPDTLTRHQKFAAVPPWDKLPAEQKAALARDMEVYAAMLEYLDMSVGRVLEYLKKENMYDNTMIVFMSDNGANGAMATSYPGNEDNTYLGTFDNSMANRGLKNSYVETGPGWAQASSAPFRLFKTFVTEGGIRAPLIVKMPGNAKQAGTWNKSFCHVADLMPTILELTGVNYPDNWNNHPIHPLIGKSLMPVLHGDSVSVHTGHGMGWELFEMKAYIRDQWKITRLPYPLGTGEWQLYDLSADPGETTDLSMQHPDVKKSLIEAWNAYAKHNEVYDHKAHYDSIYRKTFASG